MKTNTTLSILMAGLIASAGAMAQNSGAAATSSVPAKAGEASTQVQGVPNANPNAPVSASVNTGVAADVKAGATSKGEAGTTDKKGQQAGLEATPQKGKTRSELKAERELQKAQKKADKNLTVMGNTSVSQGVGASAPAGVPSGAPAGTPSVQQGGTAK